MSPATVVENIGATVQPGVDAPLSTGKSWVQIPLAPPIVVACPELASAPAVNRMAPRGGCRFEPYRHSHQIQQAFLIELSVLTASKGHSRNEGESPS